MNVIPGLVSVIIPVHNRPKLLQEAVESVLAQTYRPLEILVIDNASTDDTRSVADALASKYSELCVINQNKRGPGPAREAGRLRAQGEYIQHLDSDDLLLPAKFEAQVRALTDHLECDVVYGKTRHYPLGHTPSQTAWKRTGERIETMFPAFLVSRWWGTSTPLYRRSVIDAAGSWVDLLNEEDWEYDCRIAAQGIKLCYCDTFVSDQRITPGERLSRNGNIDPVKMRDRAKARQMIYRHAVRFGIDDRTPEMQHFARDVFLLSRQAGALRLEHEARKLFELSRTASGERRAKGIDFRLYGLLAGHFGWSRTGAISCKLDKLRALSSGR